jgi:hypothetical protein
MTFEQAVEEMKVLAGDDDWSFQYKVASYLPQTEIHGYIARFGHAAPHNTYQGAIDNMRATINTMAPIDDQAPNEMEVAQ